MSIVIGPPKGMVHRHGVFPVGLRREDDDPFLEVEFVKLRPILVWWLISGTDLLWKTFEGYWRTGKGADPAVREQVRGNPKKNSFRFYFLKEGEPRSGKQHWCVCLGLELQALLAIRKANSAAIGCCGCGFSAGGPIERGRNEADIKGNLARRYTYMTYEAFLLVGVIQTSCDYCFVHK